MTLQDHLDLVDVPCLGCGRLGLKLFRQSGGRGWHLMCPSCEGSAPAETKKGALEIARKWMVFAMARSLGGEHDVLRRAQLSCRPLPERGET